MPVDLLSRYRDLPVIEGHDARRGLVRALPLRRPPAASAVGGRPHRVNDYEPLDLLALKHYGRETLYWVLLEQNGAALPEDLVTGQTITIPPLNGVTQVSRTG